MPDGVLCTVCGEVVPPARHAICDECLQPFHLNLRTDIDETSCGAAYVGAACGWSVYCDPCGARLQGEAAGGRLARVG
ncbi:MAG: hypothetical protein AB7L91_00295 [Dehalococcoidia bacterium]